MVLSFFHRPMPWIYEGLLQLELHENTSLFWKESTHTWQKGHVRQYLPFLSPLFSALSISSLMCRKMNISKRRIWLRQTKHRWVNLMDAEQTIKRQVFFHPVQSRCSEGQGSFKEGRGRRWVKRVADWGWVGIKNQSVETCWCCALVGMEEQSKNTLRKVYPRSLPTFSGQNTLVPFYILYDIECCHFCLTCHNMHTILMFLPNLICFKA